MKKARKSPEALADEIAKSNRKLFTAKGQEWQGDVFYSTINEYLRVEYGKHYPFDLYHAVTERLRELGFLIHS